MTECKSYLLNKSIEIMISAHINYISQKLPTLVLHVHFNLYFVFRFFSTSSIFRKFSKYRPVFVHISFFCASPDVVDRSFLALVLRI